MPSGNTIRRRYVTYRIISQSASLYPSYLHLQFSPLSHVTSFPLSFAILYLQCPLSPPPSGTYDKHSLTLTLLTFIFRAYCPRLRSVVLIVGRFTLTPATNFKPTLWITMSRCIVWSCQLRQRNRRLNRPDSLLHNLPNSHRDSQQVLKKTSFYHLFFLSFYPVTYFPSFHPRSLISPCFFIGPILIDVRCTFIMIAFMICIFSLPDHFITQAN